MNQTDLNELLAEERFSPFVLTTFDGFSLAIGSEERKHMLVGARMLITLDAEERYPYPLSINRSHPRAEQLKQASFSVRHVQSLNGNIQNFVPFSFM